MDDLFLYADGQEFTYSQLLADLNRREICYKYVFDKGNHPYAIFTHIIHSFIYGYEIVILDGELSELELLEMGIRQEELSHGVFVAMKVDLRDMTDLISHMKHSSERKVTLFTSGTTGKPKKITHRLNTLARNVICSDKHADDIWALAYHPAHMAGIQVFFQALHNRNPLIYTFNVNEEILDVLIAHYQITHISATPTYYRKMLPHLKKCHPQVRSVASGGERFDNSVHKLISSVFPNAKILNIYASTESGSLFVGEGEYFKVNSKIRPFIKVSIEGELLIHQTLLGELHGFSTEDEWYNTGDIIETSDENQIRFISRNSEFINVGGYKVNPSEVEQILMNVPGVIDVTIRGHSNSITGSVIVADIVKDHGIDGVELKKTIKQYASEHLQSWKVPRLIHFSKEMNNTRTGKKLRNK